MRNPALAAAVLATFALPAGASSPLPASVTDGFYVTLEEVRQKSGETFRAFAGPDGPPITQEQFVNTELPPEAGPEGRNPDLLRNLFAKLDIDGDGRLTRQEWDEQIASDLAFADENEDGRITLKELSNARENMGIGAALGMMF